MDITHNFKAAVMAVKLQRRNELTGVLDKNRILPTKSANNVHRDEFSKQAKEVCQKITALRDVLLENRAAYMRIGQHLKNAQQMTDEQRDLIDRESEKFVTYYTQYLAQMRADWQHVKRKPQQRQHIDAVIEILVEYLHSVQQIYQEQKKYRVQHELETYRLLKLAADKKQIPVRPAGEYSGKRKKAFSTSSHEDTSDFNNSDENSDIDLIDDWHLEKQIAKGNRRNHKTQSNIFNASAVSNASDSKSLSSQKIALDDDIEKEEAEAETTTKLSPEDVQMFEEENVQLYHELQGLSEEVELIEKNVVDIAHLQDIFTEKVTMQKDNIDRIANAVVGATENVKDANEQIKQAIQRNAGLRVWSLFFLLVMSFALLFLDWYYD